MNKVVKLWGRNIQINVISCGFSYLSTIVGFLYSELRIVSSGIVYWTVLGGGSQFGSIKRAYMPTFIDNGNNPVKEVDLNLRYISKPDGIAVDWIGG